MQTSTMGLALQSREEMPSRGAEENSLIFFENFEIF